MGIASIREGNTGGGVNKGLPISYRLYGLGKCCL